MVAGGVRPWLERNGFAAGEGARGEVFAALPVRADGRYLFGFVTWEAVLFLV